MLGSTPSRNMLLPFAFFDDGVLEAHFDATLHSNDRLHRILSEAVAQLHAAAYEWRDRLLTQLAARSS